MKDTNELAIKIHGWAHKVIAHPDLHPQYKTAATDLLFFFKQEGWPVKLNGDLGSISKELEDM